MHFEIVERGGGFPQVGKSQAFLKIDYWNDYSFITMFEVVAFDREGNRAELGSVKIGFHGQTTSTATFSMLPPKFEKLQENFFSLGQDVKYYETLMNGFFAQDRELFLSYLNDIAIGAGNIELIKEEDVFRISLLRYVSFSVIEGQFRRVLSGGVTLSDFDFDFVQIATDRLAGINLTFSVKSNSKPRTNIHSIIGRNGVGKTTLLNRMISTIINPELDGSGFFVEDFLSRNLIDANYFSSLVSVAFSAFDPFAPPPENLDPGLGTRYSYIGLKDIEDETGTLLKSLPTLRKECVASLGECFAESGRKERWLQAIKTLESDENFGTMNLDQLAELSGDALTSSAVKVVERMSSGHAVVLLTLSRLVARVEEKTLVIIDEPESHLHPPLLSAFTRALSELLHNRNGVAIIATHSPVVLQEVPRSCVNVITRSRLSMLAEQPRIETFGENVGALTREVFGLEVSQSGYHALLQGDVERGETYEAILASYDGQLGQEARGILRAMVADRDSTRSLS